MNMVAKKIEGLLLITADELSFSYIQKTLEIEKEAVETAIEEIKNSLTDHGLALVVTDTHVKLTTSPDISDFISQFTKTEAKSLSKAAAETLSLIAYRGPIATHDITVIRGVDSQRIVTQLLRRGLIQKAATNTDTALYEISIEFLQHLGLTTREELPEFDKLSNNDNIRRIIEDAL